MRLHIPFRFRRLCLDEFHPLEIPRWNLTLHFGSETSGKWRRIVSQNPKDIQAQLFLAGLLPAEKQYEQAVVQYQTVLALLSAAEQTEQDVDFKDDYAQVHHSLGDVFLASGNRLAARAEWEKVIALGENGYLRSAEQYLQGYPADGSVLPHRYLLIVVENSGNVETKPFESLDIVWPLYEGWKQAVRQKNIQGVGLADYSPDGSWGIWMELPKNKRERDSIRALIFGVCDKEPKNIADVRNILEPSD